FKLASLLFPLLAFAAAAVLAAAAGPPLPQVSDLPSHPELPDPLRMLDGRPVTSKRQWEQERRPELKRLFQHYMYGFFPESSGKIRAKVEREASALGGKAALREATIAYGPEGTPPIHLLVLLPKGRKEPAPC